MAAPLVISFWARAGFELVDIAYASQLEDAETAIAAIGLTAPFAFLWIACWVGASNGLTARLSAAMGAREGAHVEQLKRAAARIIWGIVALFLALALWIWFGAAPPGRSPLLHENFRIYAAVMLGGSALTGFWSILPDSLVKAHQDTKSTMWAGLISGTLNVLLNTLFVFGFGWGIFGIALSTVLGRLGGLIFALHRAAGHERRRLGLGGDTRPGVFERPVRAIGAIGIPAALGFFLMALETRAVYWILERGPDPTASVAAWAVFDQAARFLAMPVIATGVAMLPLAARLWGSRDLPAVGRELRVALLSVAGYALVVVAPLCLLLAPSVASALFSGDPAVEGDAARRFTELGLRVAPLTVLGMGPLFILRSAFEGMQRPRPGLAVAAIRTLILVIPLTLLGTRLAARLSLLPIGGAYLGFTVGAALASLLLGAWMRRFLRRDAGRASPVGE